MTTSTTTFQSAGDSEIDDMRRSVAVAPTTEDTYPRRMAILTAWINLLHRQGADLTDYAPIFDRIKVSRDNGDDAALFNSVDHAFAFLDKLQSNLETTRETVLSQPSAAAALVTSPQNWAVYGGNVHHTASTDEPGPQQGELAWKKAIGLAWYARAAIENDRVYVTVPCIRTLLRCLDLETGDMIWQTRRIWTRDTLGITNVAPSSYVVPGAASTPVVLEDTVIVNQLGAQGRNFGNKHMLEISKKTGEIIRQIPAGEADYRIGYAPLAANADYVVYPSGTQRAAERPPQLIGQNRIICKDRDGTENWDFHVGPTFSEPVIDQDRVYTGTADGTVYCLNLSGASGVQHFGFSDERRVIWQYRAAGAVNTAVAIAEQHVFFGSNDGTLHCLNKHTGARVWQTRVHEIENRSFKLFSTPLVAGNHVYVGSAARRVYCFDAQTGAELWQFETDDWIRARPCSVNGQILLATMRGTLYCLDSEGNLVWQTAIGTHPIYADLVTAAGKVVISASDLSVWCVDAASGNVLWQHKLLDYARIGDRIYQADELACGGWFQSKPTAAAGMVFIGTPSRFVFAFDHQTGAEIWRFEVGGAVSAAPAYADGKVYFGQKGEEYFYCVDATTGEQLWKQAVGWVWSSANVDAGRVFVPGSDGYVSCLDANNGHIIWRYRTGSSTAPEPPVDDGRVFFGSWDHFVYALDTQTGQLLWQFHTGGSPDSGAPIAYRGRLYVPMGGNRVCCLDATTGDMIWEHRLPEGDMNASPALWNDRLFISMGLRPGAIPIASRIQCLDAATGDFIWEHPGGGITGPSVADGNVYFASTSSPFFYCVDAAGNGDSTTTCHWRYEMGERVYESVPAIYAGRVFILNENGYLFALQ